MVINRITATSAPIAFLSLGVLTAAFSGMTIRFAGLFFLLLFFINYFCKGSLSVLKIEVRSQEPGARIKTPNTMYPEF
jgi:hypothetical protein